MAAPSPERTAVSGPVFCIDGGGTRSRARLVDGMGQTLAAAASGPCNPSTNRARALESLADLWAQCCGATGRDFTEAADVTLSIGAAGLYVPSVREAFLAACPPFGAMRGDDRRLCGADRGRRRAAERLHHRRHGGRGPSALCRWPLDPARCLGLGRGRSRQRRLDRAGRRCGTRWRRSTASCRATGCRPRSRAPSAARRRCAGGWLRDLAPDRLGALRPWCWGRPSEGDAAALRSAPAPSRIWRRSPPCSTAPRCRSTPPAAWPMSCARCWPRGSAGRSCPGARRADRVLAGRNRTRPGRTRRLLRTGGTPDEPDADAPPDRS